MRAGEQFNTRIVADGASTSRRKRRQRERQLDMLRDEGEPHDPATATAPTWWPGNIIEAVCDGRLWARWYPDPKQWQAWFAFLKAVFALEMTAAELDVYRRCTGRINPPSAPVRTLFGICGRQAGKTRTCATIAAFLAIAVSWHERLAPAPIAWALRPSEPIAWAMAWR